MAPCRLYLDLLRKLDFIISKHLEVCYFRASKLAKIISVLSTKTYVSKILVARIETNFGSERIAVKSTWPQIFYYGQLCITGFVLTMLG